MKVKISIALVLALVVGFFLGGSYIRFNEYARGAAHVTQSKELIKEIIDYKESTGAYPDKSWFRSLGDRRITSEGRLWVYHNPPLVSKGGGHILISAPVDYGSMYMCGFSDGVVMGRTVEQLENLSEQVGAPNPTPPRSQSEE